MVVATDPHPSAFEFALSAKGVDVAAARASGRDIVLDAEKTMRRFLVRDWPDRCDFEQIGGNVIRRACDAGRPVRGDCHHPWRPHPRVAR